MAERMTREVLNEIISGYGMAMREGPDYEDVMKAINDYVNSELSGERARGMDKLDELGNRLRSELKDLQESNQRLLDIIIKNNIEIDTLKSKKDGKTGS